MLAGWTGRGLGAVMAITVVCVGHSQSAEARGHAARHGWASGHGGRYLVSYHGRTFHGYRYGHRGYTSLRNWANSGLQCVPFARENSGIELTGNAGTWWDKAEGLYERGAKPEVGSILNFRATGRMRMGHVAVVTNVIDGRHIEIDHANWTSPGRISRDIDVVDVSSRNDWTAVRVEMEATSEFGSIYPTYGFIYDRPDDGVMLANAGVTVSPARTASEPAAASMPEEVAEAADDGEDAGTSRAYRRSWRTHGRSGRHAFGAAHGRWHHAFHGGRAASVYRVSSHAGAPASHRHRHF